MGHRTFQELQLERERVLGELATGENRAKLIVRLIDIDEQLEGFTPLSRIQSGEIANPRKTYGYSQSF